MTIRHFLAFCALVALVGVALFNSTIAFEQDAETRFYTGLVGMLMMFIGLGFGLVAAAAHMVEVA